MEEEIKVKLPRLEDFVKSDEELKKIDELSFKVLGSQTEVEDEAEGGVEYRGYTYFPKDAGKNVDYLTSKEEIDEYVNMQDRLVEELEKNY